MLSGLNRSLWLGFCLDRDAGRPRLIARARRKLPRYHVKYVPMLGIPDFRPIILFFFPHHLDIKILME
jgi:hypothetical protein